MIQTGPGLAGGQAAEAAMVRFVQIVPALGFEEEGTLEALVERDLPAEGTAHQLGNVACVRVASLPDSCVVPSISVHCLLVPDE